MSPKTKCQGTKMGWGTRRDPRLLPSPQSSQKAEPRGTLPLTEPSSPRVLCRKPTTRHCSPCSPLRAAGKGLGSLVEKYRPAPESEMGVGEEAANFKAAAAICLKKKKKRPLKARAGPLTPWSYARSTLTASSPSFSSAKGTGLSDLGQKRDFLSG